MTVPLMKTSGCTLLPRDGDGEPGRERFRWLVWKEHERWTIGFGTPDVYGLILRLTCWHRAMTAVDRIRAGHEPGWSDLRCDPCDAADAARRRQAARELWDHRTDILLGAAAATNPDVWGAWIPR